MTESSALVDGKYSIKDLIDIERFRRVFGEFSMATGFTVGFVSYPEQGVLFGTGWRDVCTKFHRVCPESARHCRKSNICLTKKLKKLTQLNIRQCENGLIDGATPVVIKGKHVASLFTGQIFFEKPDTERFKKQAEIYGFDSEKYLNALNEVPITTEDEVKKALSFLSGIATMIAELGLKNFEILESKKALEKEIVNRKQAEETLRDVAGKYRSLIEKSDDIIWTTDLDLHTIYVSPSVEKKLGFTAEERMQQNLDVQITPSSYSHVTELLSQELKTEQEDNADPNRIIRVEVEYYHKNGSTLWFENISTGLRDENGILTGIHGISRDITKRKRMEEKLKISNEKFSAAFKQSPNAMAISSVSGGRFIDVNDSFLQTCGWDREEIIGKKSVDLNFWQGPEQREKYVDLLKKHGEVQNFEMTFLRKNGVPGIGLMSAAIIDMDGEPHILSTMNDITDRKRTEAVMQKAHDELEAKVEDRTKDLLKLNTKLITQIKEHERTEDELRQSEEKYRNLVNLIPDPIAICREDRHLFVNQAFIKLFGYTMQEAERLIPSQLACEMDKKILSKRMHERMTGNRPEPKNLDLNLATKDGEMIPCEVSGNLIEYSGQPADLVVIRDITERKRADETLRESEKKYRDLIDNYNAPISIYDTDLNLIIMNHVAAELLGGKPEDFIGKKLTEYFPDRANEAMERHRKIIESGLSADFEDLYEISSSKRWFWTNLQPLFNENDEIYALQSISYDITERKQAEEALAKSEQLYRTLVETSPHGIVELDATLVITYCNRAYCKMIGFSSDELTGKLIYDFIYPEPERERLREYTKLIVDTQFLPSTYYTSLMTKSGKVIDTESDWNYMRDNNGTLTGIISITTDITDKKRLQAQLIRSERLAATGQLAATIAHEINSPLQGIKALLYSIEHSARDDEELLDDVGFVNTGIKNIAGIVQNLLDLNRPGKEKKQQMNVNQIIEQTLSLLQGHLRKNKIAVNLNLSSEIPDIVASPQQLGQVFLNLINNAVEAIIGVSKPESRWPKRANYTGEITISSSRDKKTVVVKISDNGPGLENKEIEHIFDPFYTRKKTMGMGIGLSVCHDIIKDHGGTIVADNIIKGGAVFTITLPF